MRMRLHRGPFGAVCWLVLAALCAAAALPIPPRPTTITSNDDTQGRMPPMVRLLLLFFASGCAALIYEVVWLQLLQLVIGLTTVSLGVLLGVGLALGISAIGIPMPPGPGSLGERKKL